MAPIIRSTERRRSIGHFPDLPLLAIFDQLPLVDLCNHIPDVCPNWDRLQSGALMARRSLHLLPSNTWSSQHRCGHYNYRRWIYPLAEGVVDHRKQPVIVNTELEDGQFHLNVDRESFLCSVEFDRHTDGTATDDETMLNALPHDVLRYPEDLSAMFPKLTELTIVLTSRQLSSSEATVKALGNATSLIQQLAASTGTLRVLRLHLDCDRYDRTPQVIMAANQLVRALDRVESLHTLQLSLFGNRVAGVVGLSGEVLDRLRLLVLATTDHAASTSHWNPLSIKVAMGRHRLQPNPHLQLVHHLWQDLRTALSAGIGAAQPLWPHVRSLTLTLDPNSWIDLPLVGERYRNLTSLGLSQLATFEEMSIVLPLLGQAFPQLARLYFEKPLAPWPAGTALDQLPVLPNVRWLSFSFGDGMIEQHRGLADYQLAYCFPNLAHLQLRGWSHLDRFCECQQQQQQLRPCDGGHSCDQCQNTPLFSICRLWALGALYICDHLDSLVLDHGKARYSRATLVDLVTTLVL